VAEEDFSAGEQIVLEKPERGAKDGYLQSFFRARDQMGRLIAEGNGYTDPRIRLYMLNMISGITDDTIREQAFGLFDQEIKKITDRTDLSADEKQQEIANFCCGKMQGHVISWYDQFMGITHRLRLGEV
jgi:hypothetical protein